MPVTQMLRVWAALVLVALLLPWHSLQAQQLQPVPALKARAMDLSATLGPQELAGLEAQLKTLEDETGAQVVVLMVSTTAPEDIAAYANRVAQSWKLGRKHVGDGLLVIVAKNDKRMRIEVARTLEGAIPDIMAARVIDGAMKPRFQSGDYAGGLGAAIQQLSLLVRAEQLPAPQTTPSAPTPSTPQQTTDSGLVFLGLSLLLGAPLARKLLGRVKGSLLMGAGSGIAVFVVLRSWELALGAGVVAMLITLLGWFQLLNLLLSGGSGGGGSGRGGSGGGGFRSGGGGRFGGGGASGGW